MDSPFEDEALPGRRASIVPLFLIVDKYPKAENPTLRPVMV
jgi:hypothetical protein